ncbi:MAG TPA: ImmA/IrrE family metallo-endopeptidase [Ignavibacteriaceae bacterium]|nr:ImmA/IrrE family metallo-endopeptidase [Ignavibacteriaceae bacterium]
MSALIKAKAEKVLEFYGITHPKEINLSLIAAGFDIFIEEKNIDGSLGRITHDKKRGIISIDKKISYPPLKRFTIAHELGHFFLQRDSKFIGCSEKNFTEWNLIGSAENDANQFAAELLMPELMFLSYTLGKIISLKLIKDIAKYFETSITSAAFRYVDIGRHPSALIYCTDGVVKWSKFNKDFSYKFVPNGSKVLNYSYAFDFFEGKEIPTNAEEVPLDAWFSACNNYKKTNFFMKNVSHFLP